MGGARRSVHPTDMRRHSLGEGAPRSVFAGRLASCYRGEIRCLRLPASGGARPPDYTPGLRLAPVSGASRSSGLVRVRIVVLATRVKMAVVSSLAWPRSTWMTRISVSCFSRCVAKLYRSVCGETSLIGDINSLSD